MKLVCLLVVLVIAAGCTPTRHVTVNSWSDGTDISGRPYCLVPGQEIVPGDLEFAGFAKYARRALERRGYKETDCDKAQVTVVLSYGVGGRSRPYSYSEPYYYTESAARVYDPRRYTVMGTEGYIGTLDSYVRYVRLAAYEKGPGSAPGPQRWRVDAASPGTSSDLRPIVPYMMAAASKYVGTDTERQIDVTVSAKDPAYMAIAGRK